MQSLSAMRHAGAIAPPGERSEPLLDSSTLFRQDMEFFTLPDVHREAADVLKNCRIKAYPDGSRQILVCSVPVFADGWTAEKKRSRQPSDKRDCKSLDKSRRRAVARVRDLALCTDFRYFVTLTLDAATIDRYSLSAAVKRLNVWLDNAVRRHGLAYVLVPEQHKDGAYHFHGFFNGALDAVDSGTLSLDGVKKPRRPRSKAQRAEWIQGGAHVVYNLPAWGYGFSTAIELYGDYRSAVAYVCKYITKSAEKLGGRWYYSGGKLGAPVVEYFDVICDVSQMDGDGWRRFGIDGVNAAWAVAEVDKDGKPLHGGGDRGDAPNA